MGVDVNRRRKVMDRSQKLGRCVCDPHKSCPCDVLILHNVCPCAGERMPTPNGPAPLTRTVTKAGCASKIGQGDLKRVLSGLPEVDNPNVLVGAAAGDDAGVFRLSEDVALVQTVDVFTPCVDDPYLFGQIAAANSVSDVYAMGGRPVSALSVVGFPIEDLDAAILRDILRGGIDKLAEADCPVIGGHSINDAEVKCGFAVTGLIHPSRVVERGRGAPGDLLVLTKPLGTGMIAFGVQIGRIEPACLEEAGASMATLNRDASELMLDFGAHACTDVTGFGLAGHLVEMVRAGGVSAEIELGSLPVFAAAQACIDNEILPGGIERNQEYAMAWVRTTEPRAERDCSILYDPQTSGGLLVALPPDSARAYVEAMIARGHAATSVIGRLVPKKSEHGESEVVVLGAGPGNLVGRKESIVKEPSEAQPVRPSAAPSPRRGDEQRRNAAEGCDSPPASDACCDHPPAADAPEASADPFAAFRAFMKQASGPGLIDRRAKKLMAIVLSIAHRCRPCLEAHLEGARAQGISWDEIDEAASIAVSFGGCTAMMLYKEVADELRG